MRVRRIRISGFRAFARQVEIDLDSNAIILVGENGSGKTSLFDALLWGLTGDVPRLSDGENVISKYSRSGEARVELDMRLPNQSSLTITRSFDGSQQRLSIDEGGSVLRDELASARLVQLLSSGLIADQKSLAKALTRSVYLEQDLVRQFIQSDDDSDRFRIVSELVGTGAVTEFQMQMERARRAWNGATKVIQQDADRSRTRLLELQQRVSSVIQDEQSKAELSDRWTEYWRGQREEFSSEEPHPLLDASDSAMVLETSVGEVDQLLRMRTRVLEDMQSIAGQIELIGDRADFDATTERARLENLREEANKANRAYEEELARIAQLRRNYDTQRRRDEEFRALASLALRILGERCPVCDQHYDPVATRRRLEDIAERSRDGVSTPPDVATELQSRASHLREEFERESRALAAKSARWSTIEQRLSELGLLFGGSLVGEKLQSSIVEFEARTATLARLRQMGEALVLRMSRLTTQLQLSDVQGDIDLLQGEVQSLDSDVKGRDQSAALGQAVIEAIRDVGTEIVQHQLTRCAPMLQRVFAAMDPHPSFRAVSLLTRMSYGHGRLDVRLDDFQSSVATDHPETILSSSQSNALAVSLFLTTNLVGSALPVELLMIDDPMQSLDDIHRLGLVDLLRRTKDRRQLIVSTHDWRAAELLMKKLRPVREQDQTTVWEFKSWTRNGPLLSQRTVERDRFELRLAV